MAFACKAAHVKITMSVDLGDLNTGKNDGGGEVWWWRGDEQPTVCWRMRWVLV